MKTPADIARELAPARSRHCSGPAHLSHLINTNMRRIDWMAKGSAEFDPQPEAASDDPEEGEQLFPQISKQRSKLKIVVNDNSQEHADAIKRLRESVLRRKQEKLALLMQRVQKHNLRMQLRDIVAITCQMMGMPLEAAYTRSRHKEGVELRSLIVWLAKRHTSLSYPLMGKLLGGRDHSTMIHANKKVESSPELLAIAEAIEIEIKRARAKATAEKEQADGCECE